MNKAVETLLYGMQFRRLMEKKMEAVEQEYGLQRIDMHILFFLENSGEHNTSKDILKLHMFTRGHISQALNRLQKKGYVRVQQDERDRRCIHNYLTDDAGAITEVLRGIYKNIRDIVLDGVTEEEQEVMERVARKVNQNISKVL